MPETTAESQVLLRRYEAASYGAALDSFEADLPGMADAGWFPIGHVWGWDIVGSTGWLISGSS